MVAVDLTSEEWRTIPLPYLISLHASSVTFLTYVSDVSPKVWNDILASGKQQIQETVSSLVSSWAKSFRYLFCGFL